MGEEFVSIEANSGGVLLLALVGVVAALLVGKVVGITGATIFGLRAGMGRLPDGLTVRHVIGIGLIAGISLTVSLFVADRASPDRRSITPRSAS